MTKARLQHQDERGAALIMALITMALLLALAMGMSLTAISEQGVTKTYKVQTTALQAAEAGLSHAASLVSNYTGDDFTTLLALRPTPLSQNYLDGNNPFVTANAGEFAANSLMIDNEDPAGTRGHRLRDADNEIVEETFYRVSLIDDEPTASTALPRVPNFNPGNTYKEVTAPNASNPNIDKNNRLVVYSTGTHVSASVTLEGWIAFLPFPAFVANRNVEISGNSEVNGAYGAIHSNQDLIAGNGGGQNWWVAQTATASGTITGTFTGHVGGFYGGGQGRFEIPPLVTTEPLPSGGGNTSPRIQEFLIRKADVLLLDPGFADGAHELFNNGNGNPGTQRLARLAERLNVTYSSLAAAVDSGPGQGNNVSQNSAVAVTIFRDANGLGTAGVVASPSDVGWSYSSSNWGFANNSNAHGHTFYVIGQDNFASNNPNGGNIRITGNIGSNANPLEVTMMATGSISIQGTPNLTANLRDVQTPFLPPFVQLDVLMIAVEDIMVRGDLESNVTFTGISFAGEAVDLSANGAIDGQVLAYGNNNINGSLVQGVNGDPNRNTITGNFNLTLNDGNSVGKIKLFSWRQIKR